MENTGLWLQFTISNMFAYYGIPVLMIMSYRGP